MMRSSKVLAAGTPVAVALASAAIVTTAAVLVAVGVIGQGAAREIPYTTGTWNPETLGNHRAVVRVDAAAEAVRVHVPWRRRDADPDRKDVWIISAKTGERVMNVVRLRIDRETGDFVFQPAAGPGDYYVYYLPNSGAGRSNYPRVVYPRPQQTADPSWLQRSGAAGEPHRTRADFCAPGGDGDRVPGR